MRLTDESMEPSAKSTNGFILTLAIIGTMMAVTGLAQLPFGLGPAWAKAQQVNFSAIWPQGWSFFASGPDRGGIAVYVGLNGVHPGVNLTESHASGRNQWGLGNTATEQLLEINELMGRIPPSSWRSCPKADPLACAESAAVIPLANESSNPTLCGSLVLAHLKLGPLSREPVVETVANLRVSCP